MFGLFKRRETVTPSSGNVFADIGMPNAEAKLAEAAAQYVPCYAPEVDAVAYAALPPFAAHCPKCRSTSGHTVYISDDQDYDATVKVLGRPVKTPVKFTYLANWCGGCGYRWLTKPADDAGGK